MKLGAWLVTLTVMLIFLTFVGIETGLNSLLQYIGIDISEGVLQGADIGNSSLWSSILGALAVVSGGVIIIGLFAKGYDPSLIILPLVIIIGGLYIPTFWSLINYVASFNQWWMTALITTIFGGIGVGFAISLVDYFAGR